MRSLIIAAALFAQPVHAIGCLSPAESELIALVNAYRVQNGLSSLPVSRWLATTAQWHIWDRINNPSAVGGACSTHSWSNNPPAGVTWQGVCYTGGAQAAQMWSKPREISAGRYTGNGLEIAADVGGTMTAAQALSQWQASPVHNAVILQQGAWSGVSFGGMGAGIGAGYAVVWFGDRTDPDGSIPPCATDDIFANGFEG